MSLRSFCEWLAGTDWSIALHESFYMYPWIESSHVLLIALFVGTLMIVDLRLLGVVFRDTAVSEVTSKLLPWTIAGFILSVITGILLFYAIPVRTYQSIFFRIKVIVLIIAGINAMWFHFRLERTRVEWDTDEVPPRRVRMVAIVSLSSWATIIVTGRLIAYNWFDCDRQPQSGFINWATSCVVDDLS
jgi:hypothetical protein